MRFVIAAVVALVTMTFGFESNSNFNRDLQEAPQETLALTEPASREGIPRAWEIEARWAIESNNALSTGAAGFDPESLALVSDAPEISEEPKKDFCDALRDAAESSGIPIGFFARLLWQESKFRSDVVSHVGAQGVAQFMPATAAEFGLDDPFDPFKALPASAKFLRRLHNQFGNLGLAAAAYNAGSGRIQKWLSRRGVLPQETRDYVRIITGNIAENWLEESRTLNLHVDLPRGAPCEGVGGLTTAKTVDVIPVGLTASASDAIRKAEVEAAMQRRTALKIAAAAKARTKIASSLKKTKAPLRELASSRTERARQIRVASATSR
jgi:hypothetical protein